MNAQEQQFVSDAQNIADDLGLEMDVYDDGNGLNNAYEDDGFLHVNNESVRVSFDVNAMQTLSDSKQNKITREVMKRLGLNVTESALV